MFAIAGKIKSIELSKTKEGSDFAKLVLCKKKKEGGEYVVFFFVFKKDVVEDILSQNIKVGDYVEITFYIKGREDGSKITNNLYADKIAVLKGVASK